MLETRISLRVGAPNPVRVGGRSSAALQRLYGAGLFFALLLCRLSAGAQEGLDMSTLSPPQPPPALRERFTLDTLERCGRSV